MMSEGIRKRFTWHQDDAECDLYSECYSMASFDDQEEIDLYEQYARPQRLCFMHAIDTINQAAMRELRKISTHGRR